MSRARWARAHHHICAVAVPIVVVAAALILATPALAGTTGGTSMPWETPLQTVQDSLAGPVAKAVGIIAIVITGLGFAFAEGGSAMRKGIGIVFGLAIAFTATTFISSFFNLTSGAVF
jgi:type IV secretion system protein TrbC